MDIAKSEDSEMSQSSSNPTLFSTETKKSYYFVSFVPRRPTPKAIPDDQLEKDVNLIMSAALFQGNETQTPFNIIMEDEKEAITAAHKATYGSVGSRNADNNKGFDITDNCPLVIHVKLPKEAVQALPQAEKRPTLFSLKQSYHIPKEDIIDIKLFEHRMFKPHGGFDPTITDERSLKLKNSSGQLPHPPLKNKNPTAKLKNNLHFKIIPLR